jgi:hypothetical protein
MLNSVSEVGVNGAAPRPVTGRYLAHAKLSAAQRAFIASDLIDGRLQLVKPTLTAAAHLARSNTAYVQAALKRQDERALIEAGVRPLALPPQPALPTLRSAQAKLADLVAEVGSGMVLDLLAHIEADHINVAVGGGNAAAANGATPH